MKKTIAIGIIGMFLLTSTIAMSAAVLEEKYVTEEVEVEATTGDTLRIYGYVTNRSGKPIEDARVSYRMVDPFHPWDPPYSGTTYTDSSGFYEFLGVPTYDLIGEPDCHYRMQANKDGGPYSKKSIYADPELDEMRVDFTLRQKNTGSTQGSQSSQEFTTPTTTTPATMEEGSQSIGQRSTSPLFLRLLERLLLERFPILRTLLGL